MRTLSLDLDALAVDSFETDRPMPVHGTVRGNEALVATGVYSCGNTCRCPSHHDTECC